MRTIIAAIKNMLRLRRDHRTMAAMRKANPGQSVYVMPPWNVETMTRIIREGTRSP